MKKVHCKKSIEAAFAVTALAAVLSLGGIQKAKAAPFTESNVVQVKVQELPESGWTADGMYWYENGVQQGLEGRGKEIYDSVSDAWYWLDSVNNGKKAVSKDVYQESWAGEYADNEDGTGKWVRYDENGHMIKGWNQNAKGTYYFEPVTGAMAKGAKNIDGVPCAFDDETGIAVDYAWYTVDGVEYWYQNGVRQGLEGRGKEIYDAASDAWYWLDSVDNGKKAVSKDVYQDSWAGEYADNEDGTGKWVRYDENGVMIKGWNWSEEKQGTYYFEPVTGAMAKGTKVIDGVFYTFDEVTGKLMTDTIDSTTGELTGLTAEQLAKYGKGNPFHVQANKEAMENDLEIAINGIVIYLPNGDSYVSYSPDCYSSATFEKDGKIYLEEAYEEGSFEYYFYGVANSESADLAEHIKRRMGQSIDTFDYVCAKYVYDADTDMTTLYCQVYTIEVTQQ